VRQSVSFNYARFLFKDSRIPSGHPNSGQLENKDKNTHALKILLSIISSTLQKIHAVFSLDSMLLVVSPLDNSDAWLGGSLIGREFWRGLRGGGDAGSRAFKNASKAAHDSLHGHSVSTLSSQTQDPPLVPLKSQAIKSELVRVVRQKLRRVTLNEHYFENGAHCNAYRESTRIRDAEMKWTKPQSLESSYGIKLMGWPPSIPFQNPSNNNMESNRLLLDGFVNGSIKFVRLSDIQSEPQVTPKNILSPPQSTISISKDPDEGRGSKRKRK
jgi:hypothetical protein